MALRNQIAEKVATFPDPHLGINLRESEEHLVDGEARLMQNCFRNGGVRIRRGSSNLNTVSLGAFRILGGHKYYYGGVSPAGKRLIAYSNKISVLSDAASETNLTTGMTTGLITHFTTWSITDSVYISNGTDTLRKYDGTTFSTVSGTAIPSPRARVAVYLDRLFAITANGIEHTNPRSDSVWSTNSSWCTYRPQTPGLFTAIAPVSWKGTDTIYPGLLAFQERSTYLITGADFGSDVTSATATTGYDGGIDLIDPTVGTASPRSVCSVPGVGTFWFTADRNVYWMKEGAFVGQFIGDKLQSTGTTAGIESANLAALDAVWMEYYDNILILAIPIGSATYASTQFWLDIRSLRDHPEYGPVWYGPMTGQTIGNAWVENQQGNSVLYGGEGNASTAAFIYSMRVASVFTDAVGTADNDIVMAYQTAFKSFGTPSREKYVQAVHLDCNGFAGTATLDMLDLDGTLASGVNITAS